MKLIQYNGYSVSTVDTDGLVLKHQGISSYSTEYALMHFQLFMCEHTEAWTNGWHFADSINFQLHFLGRKVCISPKHSINQTHKVAGEILTCAKWYFMTENSHENAINPAILEYVFHQIALPNMGVLVLHKYSVLKLWYQGSLWWCVLYITAKEGKIAISSIMTTYSRRNTTGPNSWNGDSNGSCHVSTQCWIIFGIVQLQLGC